MFVSLTASTGRSRRIHRIKAWNFTSSGLVIAPPDSHPNVTVLVAGIAASAAGIFVTGILVLFCCCTHTWRIKRSLKHHELQLRLADQTCRAFTFKELSRTTKSFSDSELLSSGAFGDVYKGTLPSGTLVAVKRIKANKKFGEESFLAEATSLSQIRHRNLLQLRGWCQSKEALLLVYDFMCNGSLDRWLHHHSDQLIQPLPWTTRRSILAGVASSLVYLHEEWVQCVLHRDIKSSNVMLDAQFTPYLGDFGLARFVDHHKLEKTTLLAGTLGYMAPEMIHTGRASKETDVYAFGVLVLEVVTGQRPLMNAGSSSSDASVVLIDRIWQAYETGNLIKLADPSLFGSSTSTRISGSSSRFGNYLVEAERVLQVGMRCCLPNPTDRPSMRVVSQWFQAPEREGVEIMSVQPRPFYKLGAPGGSSRSSAPTSSYHASSFSSSTVSSRRLTPR